MRTPKSWYLAWQAHKLHHGGKLLKKCLYKANDDTIMLSTTSRNDIIVKSRPNSNQIRFYGLWAIWTDVDDQMSSCGQVHASQIKFSGGNEEEFFLLIAENT